MSLATDTSISPRSTHQAQRAVNTVFVDSGGFFALYARQDADHAKAVGLFRQAGLDHWQLVTTSAFAQETHAPLLNRTRDGRTVALRFLDDLYPFGEHRR
jgi:predicted nucleic acid-binding protein